ncbi:hypothetical protein [Adhaeribacter soli]|uniref:Uncharacterized protein n=1 Tax=Adhaeribacter soli TaxID=2607655 RepID=A0A5N1ITA4_9BACT|nr:hypothetical protein [Adhaeribacter soli]KAA9331119.1 hypothetical protein F0P94_14555 [Adhaeribacter soli]
MQEEKTPGQRGPEPSEVQKHGDPDMHSSKDAHPPQGGQGGRAGDSDKNSTTDQGNERSIAGREDS